jgi:heme A synthase
MSPSRLYWYAVLIAAGTLVLVISGAAVTSWHDRPEHVPLSNLHRVAAWIVAILSIGLFILLARGRMVLSGVVLAIGLLEGWLGATRPFGLSAAITATLHAWFAALLFAAVAAIAWLVSPWSQKGLDPVQDQGWPSLRSLTSIGVVLLLVQVELGAAYRHDLMSVIPHLLGASIVALVVMTAGAFVVQQYPTHPTLRAIAVTVLIVTSIQLGLGIVALIVGLTQSTATLMSLLVRIAHVTIGSLTLASGLVLAIEVRRRIIRR